MLEAYRTPNMHMAREHSNITNKGASLRWHLTEYLACSWPANSRYPGLSTRTPVWSSGALQNMILVRRQGPKNMTWPAMDSKHTIETKLEWNITNITTLHGPRWTPKSRLGGYPRMLLTDHTLPGPQRIWKDRTVSKLENFDMTISLQSNCQLD